VKQLKKFISFLSAADITETLAAGGIRIYSCCTIEASTHK
jgi:hypothetical protein